VWTREHDVLLILQRQTRHGAGADEEKCDGASVFLEKGAIEIAGGEAKGKNESGPYPQRRSRIVDDCTDVVSIGGASRRKASPKYGVAAGSEAFPHGSYVVASFPDCTENAVGDGTPRRAAVQMERMLAFPSTLC